MAKSGFQDQENLRQSQYKGSGHLNQRINLHATYSTSPVAWHPWVFDHLGLPPSAEILELGAGPGDFWLTNLSRLPSSWRVILSDFSHAMIATTLARLGSSRSIRCATLDAQAIPFPTNSFDAVIANHMLYHVPNIEEALKECARVLKPGGELYAATNGENHLAEMWGLATQAIEDSGGAKNLLAIWKDGIKNFSLETGPHLLGKTFAKIETHKFPDALNVDQVDPIIDYLTSSILHDWQEAQITALRHTLTEELDANGSIVIRKETGLFIAKHPI